MRALWLASVLVISAAQASACDIPLMGCTFEGGAKTLKVCLGETDVSYSFGPTGGTPDLFLSEPITSIDYTTWPGVGSAIWETITFYNDGYSYEVLAGFERNPEDPQHFGGITVRQGEEEIASLTCDPDSSDFGWDVALFEAKEAAGLCWDYGRDARWKACAAQD